MSHASPFPPHLLGQVKHVVVIRAAHRQQLLCHGLWEIKHGTVHLRGAVGKRGRGGAG